MQQGSKTRINIDIIRETRKLVSGLDEKQRFKIAKRHLNDALRYKTPRLDTYSNNLTKRFKLCYKVQTADLWQQFLLVLSYIIMYAIAFPIFRGFEQGIEYPIILIMWVDVLMEVYHKKFEVLRISSRFQARFYVRILVLIFVLAD